MATCRSCGAEILWVGVPGGRVPLDVHERGPGPHRYALVAGRPIAVAEHAPTLAYTDHRTTCPANDRK